MALGWDESTARALAGCLRLSLLEHEANCMKIGRGAQIAAYGLSDAIAD